MALVTALAASRSSVRLRYWDGIGNGRTLLYRTGGPPPGSPDGF